MAVDPRPLLLSRPWLEARISEILGCQRRSEARSSQRSSPDGGQEQLHVVHGTPNRGQDRSRISQSAPTAVRRRVCPTEAAPTAVGRRAAPRGGRRLPAGRELCTKIARRCGQVTSRRPKMCLDGRWGKGFGREGSRTAVGAGISAASGAGRRSGQRRRPRFEPDSRHDSQVGGDLSRTAVRAGVSAAASPELREAVAGDLDAALGMGLVADLASGGGRRRDRARRPTRLCAPVW